ncbi:Polysaccharide monooxygenase Cel61a [Zalerion maritima]|uniref:lytic cellulose monooxygenase (C4-dehydrogenating) n=1 Tax=Zalerion maritima TaxID=339359 RepID=A0AAD5RH41_9PEZI|nr:Polysaccharide monooxygenase Cel61a [Zalerion maritima]
MKYIASLLASAGLVAAHGYVDNATIGGEYYEFYQPYLDPYWSPTPERISRPIQGNGPVEDVTLIDLQCGGYTAGGISGSEPAVLHAPAEAGSTVDLYWTLWPDSHVGPMLTYMARCPDSGCAEWLPEEAAVWFKVAEGGREGTSNVWADTPMMTAGNHYEYTIPSCLEDGYYLVRHEIIALHSAWAYPGAQFYPGCHQLKVTGGGSTNPGSLVSFPGAYAGSDPGITNLTIKIRLMRFFFVNEELETLDMLSIGTMFAHSCIYLHPQIVQRSALMWELMTDVVTEAYLPDCLCAIGMQLGGAWKVRIVFVYSNNWELVHPYPKFQTGEPEDWGDKALSGSLMSKVTGFNDSMAHVMLPVLILSLLLLVLRKLPTIQSFLANYQPSHQDAQAMFRQLAANEKSWTKSQSFIIVDIDVDKPPKMTVYCVINGVAYPPPASQVVNTAALVYPSSFQAVPAQQPQVTTTNTNTMSTSTSLTNTYPAQPTQSYIPTYIQPWQQQYQYQYQVQPQHQQVQPYQPYPTSVYLPSVRYQDPWGTPRQALPQCAAMAARNWVPPRGMIGGFYGTMVGQNETGRASASGAHAGWSGGWGTDRPDTAAPTWWVPPHGSGGAARVYPIHVQTTAAQNVAWVMP